MPYPPIKTENYQNLGGLNQKASPFMTGTNEVLEILNLDYSQPGSFSVRPGTTTIITGFTGVINSLTDFSRLSGASYKIFSNQSKLFSWNGSTSIQTRDLGATLGTTYIASMRFLNFVPFVDRLFVGGANDPGVVGTPWGTSFQPFFKTDGLSNSSFFSLPAPDLGFIGVTIGIFSAAKAPGFTTGVYITPGLYQYSFAWINDRGYMGPASLYGSTNNGYAPGSDKSNSISPPTPTGTYQFATVGSSTTPYPGLQIYTGQASGNFSFDISTSFVPVGYGISYLCVFRSGNIAISAPSGVAAPFFGITYLSALFDVSVLPLSGASNNVINFVDFAAGFTSPGFTLPQGVTLAGSQLWFTNTPRYLELYNNALFLAGFSNLPSTFYFSAIGEPELIGATQSFEVRTNDADRITGMKAYVSQLIFFKNRSFHSLSGDSASNYGLREVSAQYGCISNRASAVYDDVLFFLDRKGICSFNGAATEIISNRVEPTFRRMNLIAAQDQSIMLHVKDRNEIWTVIPTDGSTFNNTIVVYDYLANGFSVWSGPRIASLSLGFLSPPTGATTLSQTIPPFFGDFAGRVQYFSASLWTDNSAGFTCEVMPRYIGGQGNELGFSVEKMFRRLYFDVTDAMNPGGVTNLFHVDISSDFVGASIFTAQTFAISNSVHVQPRLDFGVPGKAASFRLSWVPQTPTLRFNGFTIEYRYQRNV